MTSRYWGSNPNPCIGSRTPPPVSHFPSETSCTMPAEIKSVLIVGGSGFLGAHLIEEFWSLQPRPEIHVFDIRPLGDTKGFAFDKEAIHVHIGDLTKESDVKKIMQAAKPRVVVHSASPIHGMDSSIYWKVNFTGTNILLDTAKELKIPAFVYTSSAGVCFNGDDLYGIDETWPYPYVAMDAYNLTKQKGEVAVLKANTSELRTVAIRPSGIFGPGDRQLFPGIRNAAREGRHHIQISDNNNLFDATYAGNVAYAHVLAAQKLLENAPNVAGEAFFVTNDSPVYFWSLAKQIWKADGYIMEKSTVIPYYIGLALGYCSQWYDAITGRQGTFTAYRVRTISSSRYYNISKAKKYLDYKPKWTLEEAINITVKRDIIP